MQKNHLGGLFLETIYEALRYEYLLYSDAYRLTGMGAKSFKEFFQRGDVRLMSQRPPMILDSNAFIEPKNRFLRI